MVAAWWKERIKYVGPYGEHTTVVFVPITTDTGLERVHPTWAGTYILDACVYLFPNTNFALIDSDCVPVTLYEVQELWRSCDDFAHSGDPLAPDQTPTSPIAPAHKRARSEFVLDSKTEPLGCYVAMHCRYCTETKTLGKHLNSSASFLFQLGAL